MKHRSSEAIRKAAWMGTFSDAVVALAPQHAGKIHWADATHLRNSGYTPEQAAERYVEAQKVSRTL